MEDPRCRLCLSNNTEMISLFPKKDHLINLIYNCTGLKITFVNGLPRNICQKCFEFLKKCRDFIKLSHLTNKRLLVNNKLKDSDDGDADSEEGIRQTLKVEPIYCEIDINQSISYDAMSNELNPLSTDESGIMISNEVELVEEEELRAFDDIKVEEALASEDGKAEEYSEVDEEDTMAFEGFENDQPQKMSLKPKPKRIRKDSRKICEICGELKFLKTHMRIHTKEKPFKCPQCSKCYSQKSALDHHIRVHNGERPFPCEQCKWKFTHPSHLRTHIKVVHLKEKTYGCDICGRSFGVSHSLKHHIKSHRQDRQYACRFCDKLFLNSQGVKKHERIHTGDKPYKCEQCGECFTYLKTLKSHANKVHNVVYLKGVRNS